MKRPTFSRWGFFPLVLLLLISSCSVKKIVYFNDLEADSLRVIREAAIFTEPVIQTDDILSINIQTLDPATAAVANQAMVTQAIGASSAGQVGNQLISGFLVDKDGYVNMTLLGKVKVSGLTTYEAREHITTLAAQFYKDPAVQVRFANFKITVLGEVSRPATYTLPNERITIFDAIGLAGDLTVYGKRENVLLIREKGLKEREMVRLDLTRTETLSSPYFYLRQNDVVYVEPNKGRSTVSNAPTVQAMGIITSVVSLLVLAFTNL